MLPCKQGYIGFRVQESLNPVYKAAVDWDALHALCDAFSWINFVSQLVSCLVKC